MDWHLKTEVRHVNKLQVESQASPRGLSQARLIEGWLVTHIEIIALNSVALISDAFRLIHILSDFQFNWGSGLVISTASDQGILKLPPNLFVLSYFQTMTLTR